MDHVIRSDKEPKLVYAHGTPRYSRITKSLSLGMPRKASPLSSTSIGNFTWSYIFIHHMICVLLGASFSFVSICLLLIILMFCIFSFNKKSQGQPFPCLFCQYTCCCLKTESLPLFQKFPRNIRASSNIESFCILSSDITVGILVHNFWSQGSIDTLALFTDCTVLADCCYVYIVCICLLV